MHLSRDDWRERRRLHRRHRRHRRRRHLRPSGFRRRLSGFRRRLRLDPREGAAMLAGRRGGDGGDRGLREAAPGHREKADRLFFGHDGPSTHRLGRC